MKRKDWIIISVFTLMILIVRIRFMPYESIDYDEFIKKWIAYIKDSGGINALKSNFADYNYPYLLFLIIVSYIPIKSLYLVKILSIIFDYLLIILGVKYVYKYTSDKSKKIVNTKGTYICLSILPVIIMNSSLWGQLDSIYTFFCLLSLYYLLEDKIIKSFILLGVAFSIKLQFIFILPLFIILLFCKKNIKIYHFLIIPIINFIMCIPAYILGGNLLYTYKTYFLQTKEYGILVRNSNVYTFLTCFKNISTILKIVGVIITLLIFLVMLIYYIKRKDILNDKNIINLTLLILAICYFFLPCMHERYSYMLNVFSVIWFYICNDKKKKYIPILFNLCASLLYLEFLAGIRLKLIGVRILSILYLVALCGLFIYTIKKNNEYYKEKKM